MNRDHYDFHAGFSFEILTDGSDTISPIRFYPARIVAHITQRFRQGTSIRASAFGR